MSHKATAWAFDQRLPSLQKLVLITLADRHNGDSGRCDPSLRRIAEDCGMSESSVKRAIKALEDIGLLRAIQRSSEGVSLSNSYRLNFAVSITAQPEEVPEGGSTQTPPGGHTDPTPQSQGTPGGSTQTPGVGPHRPTNRELKPVSKPVTEPTRTFGLLPVRPIEVNPEQLIAAVKLYRPIKGTVVSSAVIDAWGRAVEGLVVERECTDVEVQVWLLGRVRRYVEIFTRWEKKHQEWRLDFVTWLNKGTYHDADEVWESRLPKAKDELPTSIDGAGPAAWLEVTAWVAKHGAAGRSLTGPVTERDTEGNPLNWGPDIPAPKLDKRIEFALSALGGNRKQGLVAIENTPPEKLKFLRTDFLTAYAQTGDLEI